jgi:hypothetical protein
LQDEDVVKGRSPAPRPERRENPEAASIIDLQASAGNRAVQALLESRAADPALAPLQRQPADQAPGAEPADTRTSAAGTMTIPDMDLVMPILSFQQQVGRPNQPKTESGEVIVAVALENLDPAIQEAVAKGRHFDTITVAIGSKSTFTLHSVVFSSFQVGSDIATVSLNFASMEFSPGA